MTAPRTQTTVRVDNVHPSVTKDVLHAMFLPFGEIVEVEYTEDSSDTKTTSAEDALVRAQRLELAHGNKPNSRVAHIEFEEAVDAAAALDNMDQAEVYGQILRVTPASAMRSDSLVQGLGSEKPIWQQEAFIQRQQQGQEEDDAMTGLESDVRRHGDLPSAPVGPLPAGE